jgi:hypothetical protein
VNKILSIILYIPGIALKGSYKCLSYGNEDQLFCLMCTLGVFIINAKCSKTTGVEDFAILIFFTYIMHYFSRLERENLYLQGHGDLGKVIMSMLYRQRKANKKANEYARNLEKQMKKIGNGSRPSGQKPQKVFVFQINHQGKKGKLPKEQKPSNNSIIELGKHEYKKVNDDNKFGGYLERGNIE